MDTPIIRETLRRALRQLNPSSDWPVNLHKVLSRLGIRLRFEEKDEAPLYSSSYLQLEDPPTIIIYRQKQEAVLSARERFSIAHEIAHWVIWRRFGSLPSSGTEYWWHETVCNEFAAGLLVPMATLQQFLEKRYSEHVNPAYFPEKVRKSAAVSWEVAAKSITALPSADSAYLRLVKLEKSGETSTHLQSTFKVNCSTLTNKPGSFIGRSALLRGQEELLTWMDNLPNWGLESRSVTLNIGNLNLTDVPCTFLREFNYWVIHFCPSNKGVHIETSHKAATNK
jgi:Zn-dependent peptidase ImmA (M78 family)